MSYLVFQLFFLFQLSPVLRPVMTIELRCSSVQRTMDENESLPSAFEHIKKVQQWKIRTTTKKVIKIRFTTYWLLARARDSQLRDS